MIHTSYEVIISTCKYPHEYLHVHVYKEVAPALIPQCVQLHVMINEIINVAMWMKQSEKSGEMK